MPTVIPSNCFARRELQALISRATQLARQSGGELADNLVALARTAATIDGQLAELAGDAKTKQRHKDVLDNPHGWEAIWVDATEVVHTPAGDHVVKLSQQLLKCPRNQYVATGRHRVTLGDRTFLTTCPGELRGEVQVFVDGIPGIEPGLRRDLMAFVGVI